MSINFNAYSLKDLRVAKRQAWVPQSNSCHLKMFQMLIILLIAKIKFLHYKSGFRIAGHICKKIPFSVHSQSITKMNTCSLGETMMTLWPLQVLYTVFIYCLLVNWSHLRVACKHFDCLQFMLSFILFVSGALKYYQTLVTNLWYNIMFLGGFSHTFVTEHNMLLFFDTCIFLCNITKYNWLTTNITLNKVNLFN